MSGRVHIHSVDEKTTIDVELLARALLQIIEGLDDEQVAELAEAGQALASDLDEHGAGGDAAEDAA